MDKKKLCAIEDFGMTFLQLYSTTIITYKNKQLITVLDIKMGQYQSSFLFCRLVLKLKTLTGEQQYPISK